MSSGTIRDAMPAQISQREHIVNFNVDNGRRISFEERQDG